MKNGSILIISNQENIGNQISKKIKLLRDCDTIKIVDFIETISAVFLGLSIVLMGSGYRWPVWVTIGAAAVMIGAHVVRCRIRSKIHGLQK